MAGELFTVTEASMMMAARLPFMVSILFNELHKVIIDISSKKTAGKKPRLFILRPEARI